MVRALGLFSLLSMVGCFSSPPTIEGRPCDANDACPANYVCSEGGCTFSQGAPGGTATTSTHGATTSSGATGAHTTSGVTAAASTTASITNTGGAGTTSATDATTAVTTSTGINTNIGTVGFTANTSTGGNGPNSSTGGIGTTGASTFGTNGPSTGTTTGGTLPICAICRQNSDCSSVYCNFGSGVGFGYCDSPNCGFDPGVCGSVTCSPSGLGCACLSGSTSTVGASSTTGGMGLPICSFCQVNSQCASNYCDTSTATCQTIEVCSATPQQCFPYACDSTTQNCACSVPPTSSTSGSTGTSGHIDDTCDSCVSTGTCANPTDVCVSESSSNTAAYCAISCTTNLDCDTRTTCQAIFGPGQGLYCYPPTDTCAGFFGSTTTGITASASSSAGSTSGGSTTGSSGTTGFCTGPGIQSDTDCGGAHDVCASGTSCNQFTTIFGVTFYGCACTTADSTGTDSCRAANGANGNDLVVCDSSTLNCRQPQDEELPDAFAPMAGGEPCTPGYGQTPLPDAGSICVQPCNFSSGCSANFTVCIAGSVSGVDGGPFDGYCGYNLCGPDANPGTTVAYYGACVSIGAGDGTCQPFSNGNGGYYGLCLRNGTINTTSQCGGLLGQASAACVAGDLCVPTGQPSDPCSPQQTTFCLPACNGNSPNSGPTTPACPNFFGTQTTCQLFSGDAPGAALQAGVCY